MIDSHCHIDHIEDAESAIEESRKKGIKAIVTSALNMEEFENVFHFRKKFPNVLYICLGLHPMETDAYNDEYIDFIRKNRSNIVAVGEIGLDGMKAVHNYKKTIDVFSGMLALAQELKLPVVIHSRNGRKKAISDAIGMLSEGDIKKAMMHCFSGNDKNLKEALELGYYISYATNICWTKKHPHLAKQTPLEQMLLETDSPWLDPDSTIDNIKLNNRPWKIIKSAEVIANVKGVSRDDVLAATANNAKKFYNLPT